MARPFPERDVTRNVTRRRLLASLGATGVVTLLAACGNSTTAQPATASTASARPTTTRTGGTTTSAGSAATATGSKQATQTTSGSTGANTVVFAIPDSGAKLPTAKTTVRWVDTGGLKGSFLEKFFPAYHDKHPNITVEYQTLPWPKIAQTIPLAVRSGNAPDVFQLPLTITGAEAVQEQWVQPIQGFIPHFQQWKGAYPADTFLPGVTDFDGKTYTFPMWSNERYGTLLLYNVAYLKQAGYDPATKPLTWDAFRDAAKKITAEGQGQYYGFIIGGGQSSRWSDIVTNLASMAGALGTSGMDWKTGRYTFAADQYVAAVELLLAMKADASIFPGATSLIAEQARARFPQGVAGMILQGPWNIPQWEHDDPHFDFGVVGQPVPNAGKAWPLTADPGGSDTHWLYAKSTHGDVVGDMLSFIGSKEGLKDLLILSGGSSPVLMPSVNDAVTGVGARAHTALQLFQQQMRIGPDPSVRSPAVGDVTTAFKPVHPDLGETTQGLFTGQVKDVKQALQTYNDSMNKALDDAITAAQAKGAKVSRQDWVFPNWDPTKDYTAADYRALPK